MRRADRLVLSSFLALLGSGPAMAQQGSSVTIFPLITPFIDRSGTIATSAASQTLAAAKTNRKRLIVQNPCSTSGQNIAAIESLFLNFTSSAGSTNGSLEIPTCGSFDTIGGPVSAELVTITAPTSGHRFVAKEQ